MHKNEISVLKKELKKIYKKKRYELHSPTFIGNEIKYIKECINKKNISSFGNYKIKFINKIKKITGAKHVVLTNSGTSAIHLILKALNINEKHEILMPSLNYIASANATLYCNSSPNFVEVEQETLGVDPTKLENYLKKISLKKNNLTFNKRTKKQIKALIVLHTFGHPSRVDEIKRICDNYNIQLIEDAAEALGSYYKKKHVGIFGLAGILSFNGNKIVTTGSGGAVITNNIKIFKIIDKLSKISKKEHKYIYDYENIGFNYVMPNLNAALGFAQIENLKKFLNEKKTLFNNLDKNHKLKKFSYIFKEPKNCKSNYWLQTLILKKGNIKSRNLVIEELIKSDLQSRPLWTLLHKIDYLKKFNRDSLKISLELEEKIINIPSGSSS